MSEKATGKSHPSADYQVPPASIVNHDEWIRRRKEARNRPQQALQLLVAEKELQRHQDKVTQLRQSLPWEEVTKSYVFKDGRDVTLAQLFGRHDYLFVHHMMWEPVSATACPHCSLMADSLNGVLAHIQEKVTVVIVSKVGHEKLANYVAARGWKQPAVSSADSDFNVDFDVEKHPDHSYNYVGVSGQAWPDAPQHEQYPGASVFVRRDGKVYHTYTVMARGLERYEAVWPVFDSLPKGREGWHAKHPWNY